jgi:phosphatidate phosphatase APP1
MAKWRQAVTALVHNVEQRLDELKNRRQATGPLQIIPYAGYGTAERLYLRGRVLADKGIAPAGDDDSLWSNLVNMYRRLESDEVPGARLFARFQDVSQEVVADEEGYFEVWLEPEGAVADGRLWHSIELELLEPTADAPVQAAGHVLVPPPTAQFGVISDIDDTVVQSHATQLLRMARTVFLGNARTRLPFPGVAAFYRALQAGSGDAQNPLFYVSSSPWNLYDLLVEFFELQNIPLGPIFLRDWGVSEAELLPLKHGSHKLGLIRQMLDFYPSLPFILIGDSGQEDPEIYQQIVAEYPARILAVYIRNVSRDLARPEAIRALAQEVVQAGSTLILADDTLALAEHAAAEGWIAPAALAAVQAEKSQDEGPPDALEALLEETAEPPTVVVTGEVETAVAAGAVEEALTMGNEEAAPPTVIVDTEQVDEEAS